MPDDLRLVRMNHEAKTIIICVKMPTAETQQKLKDELEKNYPDYTVIQRKDD